MYGPKRDEYTICAMATPPGRGGISVIRISGSQAVKKVRQLCEFLPEAWDSHRAYYGLLSSAVTGEAVDEVVATLFAEGRSYTGEETVELSCHGSPVIVEHIMSELLAVGCHVALPGEFTYRAFMRGRIDLVQAESVLRLIESQSRQSARLALRQLRGGFSEKLNQLQDTLTWLGAQFEASIDFSEENIEVVAAESLLDRVQTIRKTIESLLASYRVGRLLHEGVSVALIGRPNVGKSSLLNRLIGEERAIVTAVPGTTRDVIEGRVSIGATHFNFFDTAGLRETVDEVESIGIERARKTVDEVDVLIYVVDGSDPLRTEDLANVAKLPEKPLAIIFNKMDLATQSSQELSGQFRRGLAGYGVGQGVSPYFFISAKTGEGLEHLIAFLSGFAEVEIPEQGAVVTQARQAAGLSDILGCITRLEEMLSQGASPEFPAFEVQTALRSLHGILGTEYDDQVMDRVFREFCIGK